MLDRLALGNLRWLVMPRLNRKGQIKPQRLRFALFWTLTCQAIYEDGQQSFQSAAYPMGAPW